MVGLSHSGWAKIEIDGNDCEILQEIISRSLDRAQTDLAQVQEHENYAGIVTEIGADIWVDIGIENPDTLNARISLKALRAQLCDGKPLSAKEIAEYYCIHPGGKLTVHTTRVEPDGSSLEAWLADSQIEQFSQLIATRLDSIQVFNSTRQHLDFALQKSNLYRDVISVEPITLTVHRVDCKLGTDAIGLIPKLGSVLRKSELKPFLPRRILTKCRPW
jgi:hypothetical protein